MKKLIKDSKQLVGFSIMGGVGADVITRTGGDPTVMTNLTRYTPTLGTISGSSAVMRKLKKIKY